MPDKAKTPDITFEQMFAKDGMFEAGGRTYTASPLPLEDALEYSKEQLQWYNSMTYVITPAPEGKRDRVEHWLAKCVRDEKGESVTIDTALKWTGLELRKCLNMISEVSG